MNLLTAAEFRATLGEPMRRVPDAAAPPWDFWPYFDRIPASHFEGRDCSAGEVSAAWTEPAGRFQHVLVRCADPHIFMALVLDLDRHAVHGHRLLDLAREYGLGSV